MEAKMEKESLDWIPTKYLYRFDYMIPMRGGAKGYKYLLFLDEAWEYKKGYLCYQVRNYKEAVEILKNAKLKEEK